MNLFNGNWKPDERIAYVAVMLGYDKNSPETWPKGKIEYMLIECEKLAEFELRRQIYFMLRKLK